MHGWDAGNTGYTEDPKAGNEVNELHERGPTASTAPADSQSALGHWAGKLICHKEATPGV
jgi:hypothetical protein